MKNFRSKRDLKVLTVVIEGLHSCLKFLMECQLSLARLKILLLTSSFKSPAYSLFYWKLSLGFQKKSASWATQFFNWIIFNLVFILFIDVYSYIQKYSFLSFSTFFVSPVSPSKELFILDFSSSCFSAFPSLSAKILQWNPVYCKDIGHHFPIFNCFNLSLL